MFARIRSIACKSWLRRPDSAASLAVPMLRDGSPIGAITVAGAEPAMFSERQIAMLQTFADQAVIAIENTRLFNELQTRNRDLTEVAGAADGDQRDPARDQPVATRRAAGVRDDRGECAEAVRRHLRRGLHVRRRAHPLSRLSTALVRKRSRRFGERYPMPPGRGGAAARAILTRAVVYVPDVREDPEYRLQSLAAGSRVSQRAVRAYAPRRQPNRSDQRHRRRARDVLRTQIAMLQTFADQAVIAIENTRLFNELQTRNRDLTEVAGAADGDQRDPARDQPVATRRAAGVRDDRGECAEAVRGHLRRGRSRSTAS